MHSRLVAALGALLLRPLMPLMPPLAGKLVAALHRNQGRLMDKWDDALKVIRVKTQCSEDFCTKASTHEYEAISFARTNLGLS